MSTSHSTPETIVLATDGGAGSHAALRWVADHVGARDSRVRVVAVADETRPEAAAAMESVAVALRALNANLRVETELLRGEPAGAITSAARGASLVVVGARTGGGPLTSPRVPARVAGAASCPVVVVPDHWEPGPGAIVVGSSVDSASEAALDRAADLAVHQQRPLVLVHVWELPVVGDIPPSPGGPESIPARQQEALDRLAGSVRAAHPGLQVSAVLREGSPAHVLEAEGMQASLVVVGRRRRPAAVRAVLGSVSHRLVASPPCAVMVIPAPPPGIHVTPDVPGEEL